MIGIIGAMEEEITILRKEMQDVTTERTGVFEFYTGSLCGKKTVLVRCGIGKVQAAAGCTLLASIYKPECIINTGCAGGINSEGVTALNFGDAVISSSLVYHDFDLTVFGYALGQVPGREGAEFIVAKELVARAERAVQDLKNEKKLPAEFKAVPGLIASGDVFVSDSKKVLAFKKIFPGIRAVEMESAAIAHVCTLFKVPFMVLRCLSDIAGEQSPMNFDEYLPVAAVNSSEIVKRLVTDM